MSTINPVMEAIHTAFRWEIANQFTTTEQTLTITLTDGTRAVISAPQVATPTKPHRPVINRNQHTYHYTHQTDDKKFILHNLEECRVYLDDVCHTFLNATVRDNEVIFSDGSAYLVTVTTA